MYSSIYSRLIYPAYHMVVGSKATELTRELRSHDKLSRDEMRSIESAKLVDLINHARQSVPYYEEVLSNPDLATPTGIDLQQFRKVALLTKAIIRKSKSALVSRSLAGNRVDPNSTSGSTGEPLSFFTDTRSKSYRKAAVARNRSWVGIQNGDPVARLWGAQIDAKLAESLRGKLHGLVTREIFLSAYELDNNRMAEYARAIIRHKTKTSYRLSVRIADIRRSLLVGVNCHTVAASNKLALLRQCSHFRGMRLRVACRRPFTTGMDVGRLAISRKKCRNRKGWS